MRKSKLMNPRNAPHMRWGVDWAGVPWALGAVGRLFDAPMMFDRGLWMLGTREWL
jgi:hypothetical protein